ncbi:MAG: hypothetical protein GY703_22105 [Gammaproteobacteria bacterium]|nr:hypothetical protein [Gammaproteobacteria bacterium]
MTGMLASVTNEIEAAEAAAAVDIVDMKNPRKGALGALPTPLIAAISASLNRSVTTSATVGDLPPDPAILTKAIETVAATGVDFVKVGFFSENNLDVCLRAIGRLTPGIAVIAVLFADRTPPLHRLAAFSESGCAGIMLDTATKNGQSLHQISRLSQLQWFVQECARLELLCGLAGSLKQEDIPRLLPLSPDYLGFRGALCTESHRTSGLDLQRLMEVRAAIPATGADPGNLDRRKKRPIGLPEIGA